MANNGQNSGLGFIAKVGGIYTAITSFVSDILNPIFEFTLVFLVGAAIFVAVSLAIHLLAKTWPVAANLDENLANRTNHMWFRYYFGAGVLSLAIFSGVYALNGDSEEGYLAEHVEFFKALQDDLGIVNKHLIDIKDNSDKMVKHSEEAAKHSHTLAEEQKKAVSLLKEIADPQDARKALVSYGFRVNAEDYSMKLNEGDVDMVGLFHKAGVSPAILDANGNSPLFRAVMLHAPNIYRIMDEALDSGQFNSVQTIQPEVDKLAKRKYFDSLNEWLGGSQSHLFDAVNAGKSVNLKNLNLGSCISLSQFAPSSETLEFIARNKLDMDQALKIREAIAADYGKHLDDWQKWLDELRKQDSSLYSSLSAMRDRKHLPSQKQQEEMLRAFLL